MRKRVIAFLAALTIFCTFQLYGMPVQAASWPDRARNIQVNTGFYDTCTYSDPYSLMDIGYVKVYRFQVPASGTVTINVKGRTSDVPFFYIYKTTNTDSVLWCGGSYNRSSYDYDYNSGLFWSKWTISLKSGNYYLRVLHNETVQTKLAYKLAYSPTFSSTSITSVSGGSRALLVRWRRASGVTGYQVQYSLSSNMKNARTYAVKGATYTGLRITGLTKGKRYYVRVRTYRQVKQNGKTVNYFKKWTSVKSVVVK